MKREPIPAGFMPPPISGLGTSQCCSSWLDPDDHCLDHLAIDVEPDGVPGEADNPVGAPLGSHQGRLDLSAKVGMGGGTKVLDDVVGRACVPVHYGGRHGGLHGVSELVRKVWSWCLFSTVR